MRTVQQRNIALCNLWDLRFVLVCVLDRRHQYGGK